jgi:GAF domain-containing protein
VLGEIAFQAAVLTDAEFGVVFVAEGDRFKQYVNSPGVAPATLDLSSVEASLEVAVVRSEVAANYHDVSSHPFAIAHGVDVSGIRSSAYIPIPSGDPPVGIAVGKRVVEPFTDDEIATLRTFAVQAGNAVTHARLLADIEQRNAELAESLELRTTTSAILELTALGCILP